MTRIDWLYIYKFSIPYWEIDNFASTPKETFALGYEVLFLWGSAPHLLRRFKADNRSIWFDSALSLQYDVVFILYNSFSTMWCNTVNIFFLMLITWLFARGDSMYTFTNGVGTKRGVVLMPYLDLIHKTWKLASNKLILLHKQQLFMDDAVL